MRIKICGITKPEQGKAIASLGATALGFICVPNTPRYVNSTQIRAAIAQLPATIDRIGVFANTTLKDICQVVAATKLTGVQLHGDESPAFCHQLRSLLPDVEIIKALRIRDAQALEQATIYTTYVDSLLLDAFHPQHLGGTGQTLDWQTLQQFQSSLPWFLAGGLTPDNILAALTQLRPHGIDLSSGVERSPGDKDLDRVARLFEQLRLAVSS
jgi:phosphoribosylanthranilate isomerase